MLKITLVLLAYVSRLETMLSISNRISIMKLDKMKKSKRTRHTVHCISILSYTFNVSHKFDLSYAFSLLLWVLQQFVSVIKLMRKLIIRNQYRDTLQLLSDYSFVPFTLLVNILVTLLWIFWGWHCAKSLEIKIYK